MEPWLVRLSGVESSSGQCAKVFKSFRTRPLDQLHCWGGGHSGVGGTFFHGRVRREKRQSTQTIMRFCFHLKLTVLIWNPSIVENFQDLELKPLASFMQVEFNKPNSLPMDTWLLPNRGDDPSVYEERMRLLGNIVVPACASLASEILLRVHRSWRATLSS